MARTTHPVPRYLGAVAIIALVTFLRWWLPSLLGVNVPYVTYAVALAIAAWYGGLGPGLVALALGVLTATVLFVAPGGSVLGLHTNDILDLALYVATGMIIVLMAESHRIAQVKAEDGIRDALEKQRELEREAAERERAEQEKERALAEQSRLRDAAEEQSATLANLFEQAPFGIVFFDTELRYVRANSYAAALTGHTPEQVAGRAVVEILSEAIPAEQVPGVECHFRRVIETGETFSVRGWASELLHRGGATAYFDWSLRRVDRPGGGGTLGGLLTVIEVTAEMQRERALREGEERFRVILSSIGDAVIATDAVGTIEFMNPVAESLTGWEASEARGRPLVDVFHIVHEETRAVADNPAHKVMKEGVVVGLANHTILVGKDRSERAIDDSAAPIRDVDGAVKGVVLVFRDVEERRKSERSLRESEERLRQLADTMPQMVWTAGPDGEVEYFNGRWYEYTGLSAEESLSSEGWRRVVHPEDMEQVYALRNQAVGEGEHFHVEVRLRDRHGAYRWHIARSVPVHDESGRLTRRFGTATDIDDRMRSEQALRESEERYRLLAEVLPQLVWSSRPDGRLDYCNPRWLEYTGMALEQAQGRGWTAAVHPDDLETTLTAWGRATEAGQPYQGEQRLRGKDGRYHWFLTRALPLRDEGGQVVGWHGTCTDVEDQKRATEALVLSEGRLELAQQTGRIGTFDWDPQTGRLEWSASQETLFGLPVGGFGGRFEDWAQLVHPEDRARAENQARQAVADRSVLKMEFRVVRPDGETRWMTADAKVICDGEGRPVRMIGVNQDITERKQLEDELHQRMEELAEADRKKDEFLAMLAHELRNPLAPIRNALHLMRQPEGAGVGIGAGIEPERAIAERQVRHLARLVDDLLDVSRITRGKIELRKESLLLAPIVHQAVEATRSRVAEKGHELTVTLPDEPIPLEADPTRLEQVLWNLLTNAVKYTEAGGQIHLKVERDEGEAIISVRDSGVGIEPEMLPEVFQMFVQAGRHSGHAQGGLGIGLSLVKMLVEMHGGRIEARSEGLGLGSEFIVRLPLNTTQTPSTTSAHSPAAHEAANGVRRRRILVVDDNVDAANSLARILSRLLRQDVRVAYAGPAALSMAEDFQPEIILLDIGMPGMDGYEVARRIRSRDEKATAEPLLVALTGWGQDDDRRKSKEAGFDLHLVKPVDPDALQSLLAGAGGDA